MKAARRILFWTSNIIVPLFIGVMIYVLLAEDTYVSRMVRSLLPEDIRLPEKMLQEGAALARFFRYHLCDMCWAYALTMCVCIVGCGPDRVIVAVLISGTFSIALELLQRLRIFPGTYDVFDIILEVISCIVAGMVIYISVWRKKE